MKVDSQTLRVRPTVSARLISLLTIALTSSAATAAVIELKTGERIEGAFKQATPAGAVMEVAGQSITIPMDKLKAIYFGTPPSAVTEGATPLKEALDALNALKSVTNSGIAYRDYSQRVLDARVKVDRLVSSSATQDPDSRRAIRLAMLDYEFASRTWLMDVQGNYFEWSQIGELMLNPDLASCQTVKAMVDQANDVAKAKGEKSREHLMDLGVRMMGKKPHIPEIWACAATQLGEAERLASKK